MKKYTDVFGKKLKKDDVRMATIVVVRTGDPDPMTLSRQMKIGYGKAKQLSQLLYDAGVVVDSTFKGTTILLKNEDTALNAAFRQLKKGNGRLE